MTVDEEYLQKLMRTLSHDMGGTLRCSVGFSKLLLENYSHVLDEKAIKWLNLIKSESEKTQGELFSLSRYARLYAISDSKEVCDLTTLCHKAIELAGLEALYSNFDLIIEDMLKINGYERLWVDLFAELITNSLKHNPLQTDLKCRVYSRQAENGIEVVVADNGLGLSEKHKALAVLPFKALSKDKLDHKGVGMGLSNVKRIAELHDGSFSLSDHDSGDSGLLAIINLPKDCMLNLS